MAMSFLSHTENSPNLQEIKKNPRKDNQKSFRAFLLSIFVYVSVFYVFNLSPSTLVCTTKFWFIISNTLILIIAADFGAFSSSKEHDFFHEYDKNINVRSAKCTAVASLETVHYVTIDEKKMLKHRRYQEFAREEPQEKIINMVHTAVDQETLKKKPAEISTTHDNDDDHDADINKSKEKFEKKGRRKRRARTLTAVEEAEKAGEMVLQRTISDRHDHMEEEEVVAMRLEENEFTKMSDEELHRRVEEFIRRCNRQIRLEAVSNQRQQW